MTKTEKAAAFAVFVLSFGIYLLTASPLIAAGDAGELVSAAWLLGIPHPPGYPLFCMTGKLFGMLPFGNVAYRMNLMSGFFSASCALFIYLTGLTLSGGSRSGMAPALLSAAAALAVAFSGVFWSQATYSEVYPVQLALSSAALYYALRAGQTTDIRYAYLTCLLFGLSVAGHYAGALYAPALLVYLMFTFAGGWDMRKAAWCALFTVAGLSPFAYLVPRAAAATPMNWDDPSSIAGLARHVTRASYGDIPAFIKGMFGAGPVWYKSTAVMMLALLVLVAICIVTLRKRLAVTGKAVLAGAGIALVCLAAAMVIAARGMTSSRLDYVAALAGSGAWPFLGLLSAAGLSYLFVVRRHAFYLAGLSLAVSAAVGFSRIPVGQDITFISFSEKFFLPVIVVAGILAAAGLQGIVSFAARVAPLRIPAAVVICLAACSLPAWLVADGYARSDRSRSYYAYDYSDNMLKGMEPDAVFMVEGDNIPSLMTYQKFVEMKRPDVGVYEIMGHVFPPFEETIPIYAEGRRPLYHSEAAEPDAFPGITMRLTGMLSRFPGAPVRIADPWEYYVERFDPASIAYEDYPTRETIANHLYFKGLDQLRKGDREGARDSLEGAAQAGSDMAWAQKLAGVAIRDGMGDNGRATELLMRASALNRRDPGVFIELGRTYLMAKDPQSAARNFRRALKLSPGDRDINCMLWDAAVMAGNTRMAENMRERCMGEAGK